MTKYNPKAEAEKLLVECWNHFQKNARSCSPKDAYEFQMNVTEQSLLAAYRSGWKDAATFVETPNGTESKEAVELARLIAAMIRKEIP
jgi:hypothetical protein